MSLICEQILSEDELSQTNPNHDIDEELDYEEEESQQNHNNNNESATDRNDNPLEESLDNDRDEGELDDDDDLEEGEVKEEEEEEDSSGARAGPNRKRVMAPDLQTERQTSGNANSICRFFGRGQCTWGNNCRFIHPTGGLIKRMPPMPPPLPLPPMPPHMAPHPPPNRNRPQQHRDFYDNHAVHGPPPPPNPTSAGNESAWERGLKQAKEMIVRASRRKEEEVDFEEKRFNLGVEEGGDRHSRESSHSSPRLDNDEYERRRRLAFESAPWNNDEPPKMRAAENYRDPWRRSKSPPSAAKFRRPLAGSRSGSKRSHSMSSISASGSDSSDFSGSEDNSSFSDSESNSRASGRSNRSAADGGRRYSRKSEKKFDQRFQNKAMSSQNVWNKSSEMTSSSRMNDTILERKEREMYDSWSESLSESEDSITSYYSEEESEEENESNDQKNDKRIPKRTPQHSRGTRTRRRESDATAEGGGGGGGPPPPKRTKVLAPYLRIQSQAVGPQSPPPLPSTNRSGKESPKKSPIKMTFFKKQQNLSRKDSSLKMNGRQQQRDLEREDNSFAPEDQEEEEEDSFADSPGPLSPKPTSSVSPVSQEPSTPPQPPALSSSSSSGSSKHDKSLLATVSRREELLQQLKAVEDAIARKRSKIN